MVTILDEEKFIAVHMDQIIDPPNHITAYRHQNKLLAAFNGLNLIFEISLVTKYMINHDEMDAQYIHFANNRDWGSDTFVFAALMSGFILFNLTTLIFGVWTIGKHRKHLNYIFLWMLAFSVLFEAFVTVFSLVNVLNLVLRILLLAYENFVANTLLPPAVEIDEPPLSRTFAASIIHDDYSDEQ